jgi:hypothetical protein
VLRFYKGWDPARVLGPPFNLGGTVRPDELADFRKALIEARQPSKYLAAVSRAAADLSAVFRQYESGDFAAMDVATFHATIEALYGELAARLDEANAWLGTLAPDAAPPAAGGPRRPNLELLDHDRLLTSEDLAKALGVVPEVARRRMRTGEFGPRTKCGRRKLVQARGVREALARGQSS